LSEFNEKFKKLFPKITEEFEKNETKSIRIDAVRWSRTEEYSPSEYELKNPNVISFIRRCSSNEEALEIIDFMEKRGEISSEYAENLRSQLDKEGLESFGPRKTWGYYERTFRQKQE